MMRYNLLMKYVALLRGINVGGNKKVPMADLKKALEKAGFANVKTLLASGNVIIESSEKKADNVRKLVEATIEKKFGFPVPTIIRTMDEITTLIKSDPFKGIKVTPDIRLYVSFRGDATNKKTIKIPYKDPQFEFRILNVTDGEIINYVVVDGTRGTLDAMAILEKEFGKNITTRNWNTVLKLVK
jgi:uncharacterized protein (DUF1697 family)